MRIIYLLFLLVFVFASGIIVSPLAHVEQKTIEKCDQLEDWRTLNSLGTNAIDVGKLHVRLTEEVLAEATKPATFRKTTQLKTFQEKLREYSRFYTVIEQDRAAIMQKVGQ